MGVVADLEYETVVSWRHLSQGWVGRDSSSYCYFQVLSERWAKLFPNQGMTPAEHGVTLVTVVQLVCLAQAYQNPSEGIEAHQDYLDESRQSLILSGIISWYVVTSRCPIRSRRSVTLTC